LLLQFSLADRGNRNAQIGEGSAGGLTEELAFGGVDQGMRSENLLELRERPSGGE
jgi:hypothetical protein